jgi:hypothetical protein
LESRRSKAPSSGCDGQRRLLPRRRTLVAQLRLRTHQDHGLLPLHHPRAFKITRPNRSGIWMHLINETAKALEPKWLRKARVSKLCISCFFCCVTTVSDSEDALTNLWEIIFTIWKSFKVLLCSSHNLNHGPCHMSVMFLQTRGTKDRRRVRDSYTSPSAG